MNPAWAIATVILVGIGLLAAAAPVVGARRWRSKTHKLRCRLTRTRRRIHPTSIEFAELDRLPAPVRRYLRAVLEPGRPMVSAVLLRHEGSFNMGETEDRWKPFVSEQRVICRPPGFDWNGRIAIMPGLPARVHDAYIAGEGILQASLLGLFPIADLRDDKQLAEGELMRFLAEAVWYPTAFLPGQGVRWETCDESASVATLADGSLKATLRFAFNEAGLVDSVKADARGRMVQGKIVPTPWAGRFWNYEERSGMKIPLDGEVAWVLPTGRKEYWRGRITAIEHELAN